MNISKIQQHSFSARLEGDLHVIATKCFEKGLSTDKFLNILSLTHKHFPGSDTTVKFYDRKVAGRVGMDGYTEEKLIQKVKVIRNHEILGERNVKSDGKYAIAKYLIKIIEIAKELKAKNSV